jgi:tricorn protease
MDALRKLSACALAAALIFSAALSGAPAALPYFAEPAVSPDGAEIAFVSGGDIWAVAAAGGDAHLLVAHPATESRPAYSPDGKRLAFTSTRTGAGDIYVLTFATSEVRRVTFDDANDQLDGWSRDGKWLYFSSTSREISGNDIWRVSAEGGTPMQVSADRYANEFFGAPAPNGASLAFSARGNASGQWWRKGHSHLDESEIWLLRDMNAPNYERVSTGGKNLWPMWSPDGKTIYFMSDRSGAENIWSQAVGGAARQVTQFRDGRVLWPSIAYDGRAIVFERNFEIWKLDVASGRASAMSITRRSAPPTATVEHVSQTNQFGGLTLSPDGKKVAFIARGEIFAASAKDGGDAARVTNTPALESEIAWAPDSKRIVYTSRREAVPHIYQYDFTTNAETQLTRATTDDCAPAFSPDGKLLAFVRNARELYVLDLESKQERRLVTANLERPPFNAERPFVWSPDSKWLAYLAISEKLFTNAYVVPAAGGESRQVSFLPNVFSNTISWSPDGTYLLYDTGQRTETRQLARIDLIPQAPKYREDQFRDLFKDEPPRGRGEGGAAKAATKPVEIVTSEIRRRVSIVPVGVDLDTHSISPDGKWALMIATAEGQRNLYVYSLDEMARERPVARQITSTGGGKSRAQFSPDSKEIFFLEAGRIQVATVESRQSRGVNVTAEFDVDFEQEKLEVFAQAWSYQRDNFFDPQFNGVDWNAVRANFAPRIAGARTSDEVRRLLSLMVGELNASHLGANAPPGTFPTTTGRLGLRFDRAEYERAGKLKISEVIPLSPAALGEIKTGEYLVAVDGVASSARANLDDLLQHKIGKRVALSISAAADGSGAREVVVQPISRGAENQLLYRHWVETRRAYVDKASNGQLGYVHMPDMSAGSLTQFYLDLDTENHAREGVVIDIRHNNGGFVNVYAIDVLARRPYLNMTPRGQTTAPARTVLGQRALEKPTILVIDQHSLSDAEDFTEGYRSLKLGKVVGEPTAGWIIYTSNVALVDGTIFRIPFIRVTDANGAPMEMHPRPVDIPVPRPIGESYTARDSQLDAAVAELLKQIGPKR